MERRQKKRRYLGHKFHLLGDKCVTSLNLHKYASSKGCPRGKRCASIYLHLYILHKYDPLKMKRFIIWIEIQKQRNCVNSKSRYFYAISPIKLLVIIVTSVMCRNVATNVVSKWLWLSSCT